MFAVLALLMVGCADGLLEPGPTGPTTGMDVNAQWFVTRGVPSAAEGADGDLWLDTETTMLYVKVDGAWQNVGALRGANGAGWLFGAGVPSSTLGADGDLYLDTVSTMAYRKVSGVWEEMFALQGPQGIQGLPGIDGSPGLPGQDGSQGQDGTNGTPGQDGVDGATWYTGTGNPNIPGNEPEDAAPGDLYLDVYSTIVWRKDAVAWSQVVYFQAAMVPQYIFTPNNLGIDQYENPVEMYAATSGEVEGQPRIVAVGSAGRIAYTDDGITWMLNYPQAEARVSAPRGSRGVIGGAPLEFLLQVPLHGVAWGVVGGEGLFVAVGDQAIWTSADGAVWSAVAQDASGWYLSSVTFTAGGFFACGAGTSEPLILYSLDGQIWSEADLGVEPPWGYLRGVAYGNDQYVAVGENGLIFATDALSLGISGWEALSEPEPYPGNVRPYLYGLTFANGGFIAVGYEENTETGLILLSQDGLSWQSQDLPLPLYNYDSEYGYAPLSGVASGTGGMVVVGTDSVLEYNGEDLQLDPQAVVLTSPTAVSWSIQRWAGYASGVCWSSLNGGTYVVARGDALGWGPAF